MARSTGFFADESVWSPREKLSRRNWRMIDRPLLLLLPFAGLLGSAMDASGAACSNVATGNWTAAATWSAPCNVAGGPTAADDVTIINNTTVTVNAAGLAANSVMIATGNRASTLTFAAGSSLAVTNDVTIDPPNASNRTKGITVLTGTLTVGGNVVLTGGASATQDALLSASTGSITISGGLTINATVATSSTVSLTSTGTITVNGAAGVSNGDALTIGTGTLNIASAAATFTNSGSGIVATTSISTGSLKVAGNLTNATGNTITATGAANITVGGNWSNNGTFTSGTSTVTLNGAAAQALGGSAATTFRNLTINNTLGGVTITSASSALSPTVNGTLTLTSGKVITTLGTNDMGLGIAGTVSGGSSASYVQGAVLKSYAGAGTLTFPVGDAANYTPVVITGTAGFTAGSLTISTTGADHPSLASSGINSAQSVNRYWTLTSTGLPAGSTYTATFNYVNGSPVDMDASAIPANFIVEQWNGTTWFPTALAGACTATPAANLCNQITGQTGFGDFAIGDALPGETVGTLGAFNIFESSTPAGSVLGRIYTKIAGTIISLQVVAVNASHTGVNAAYNTNPITVSLLDSRDNTGAITAGTDCRTTWTTVISTQSLSPVWTSGRSATISITAPANAWRDVRVRVVQGANTGCSSDRFSIRPTGFNSITSVGVGVAATNGATSGAPSFKAGSQSFNLTAATGLSGYDNGSGATLASPQIVPLIDPALLTGSPNVGTLNGAFGAASAGSASGSTFTYSEVGNFSLGINGVYDNVFTAVDQPGDCVMTAGLNFSNALDANGQYGCNFGNTAATAAFGRFIPDHFITAITNGCVPCGFTYSGQPFATYVTAYNGLATPTVTANYDGASYAKATNLTAWDTTGTVSNPGPGNMTNAAIPAAAFSSGIASLVTSATMPVYTFTASPTAPTTILVRAIDTDSPTTVSSAGSTEGQPVIDSGRMVINGAYGSEFLSLSVPLAAQYWNGTNWVLSSLDSTSAFSTADVVFSNWQATHGTWGVGATHVLTPPSTVTFVNGSASFTLSSPGYGNTGSVDVTANGTGTSPSTNAYLPSNPARITFGVYNTNKHFIYSREN